MPAGQGALCLTCSLLASPQPQGELPTFKVNYNLKPAIAIGILLLAGAGGGFWYYRRGEAEKRLAFDFPVKAGPSDRHTLDVDGGAWIHGGPKLLAALAAFDPASADARITTAPCTIPFEPPTTSEVNAANVDRDRDEGFDGAIASVTDPDAAAGRQLHIGPDLVSGAKEKLAAIAAVRARKRFRSLVLRDRVLGAIDDPALVVLKLDVEVEPTLTSSTSFTPGVRQGHAYAFDRETGELRCAGAFHAESSEQLDALVGTVVLGNQVEALSRDLDAQMEREIARSMHAVR